MVTEFIEKGGVLWIVKHCRTGRWKALRMCMPLDR
jgi:hypothetical protein